MKRDFASIRIPMQLNKPSTNDPQASLQKYSPIVLRTKIHKVKPGPEVKVSKSVNNLKSRIPRIDQFEKVAYERLYTDLNMLTCDSTQESLELNKRELSKKIALIEQEIAKVKVKGYSVTLELLLLSLDVFKKRYEYLMRLTSNSSFFDALDAQSKFYKHVELVLQSKKPRPYQAESLMAKIFFALRIIEAKGSNLDPEYYLLFARMQKEMIIFMQQFLKEALKEAKTSPDFADLELLYEDMDGIMAIEYRKLPRIPKKKIVEHIPTKKTSEEEPFSITRMFGQYMAKKSYDLGQKINTYYSINKILNR